MHRTTVQGSPRPDHNADRMNTSLHAPGRRKLLNRLPRTADDEKS